MSEFDQLAAGQNQSIVVEFWHFLMENKKWWLSPILLGVIIVLGGTGAAPLIYTLF